MERNFKLFIITLTLTLTFFALTAWAQEKAEDLAKSEELAQELKVIEITAQENAAQAQTELTKESNSTEPMPASEYQDPLRYVLGPDDVIEITVMRHPEFSGVYPVNLEGKIQYKFIGDIEVAGLNKKALEEKVKSIIANFVISPELNVTVLEYKSKVIYVLGEVGQPGKYYMRSETIPVREAVVQAGLPTQSAAMRKCRIITPDKNGKVKTRAVNLYSVLYGGELRYNYEMQPGDILYVPCTVMAKLIRMINPVTATVSGAAAGPTGVSSGKSAISALAK